jgi:enoyl-CoA hydratase/carnithine racemase
MADEEEYSKISARGQQSLTTLTKPLLAMIHGYCVGGGVGIALACDLRLAADDSRFGIPAARLGLGYHYSGMEKLLRLVGPSYTKEIFFTARTDFSAQDALRMGLVNQVVPKAELETFTRHYALTIAQNAPLTIRSAKATVEQLVRPAEERDLALLDRLIVDCFNSQDYQEGVQAFSEKRRPQFQGH